MNTSIKQRVGCILLSILLVVCLIGSLLCALILPFMSSNGVAKADSTNGVVEDNIILNSSFSDFSNWSVAGASISSYNPLVFSATGAWGSIYQILPYQELINQTVTLTVRFRKVSGSSNAVCNLRYRLEGQSSTTGLQSISTASTDYVLRSQTYDLSELVDLSYLQVSIYGQTSGTQVEVDFVKLEIGSTFTGYVPKDYTNYGYDQGYNEGVQDTNRKFNTLRGYSILSSPAHVLKYKYNQDFISNVNPGESTIATYMPIRNGDPPLLFTYNDVPYGFGNPISSLTPRSFYSLGYDYSLQLYGQVIPSGYTTFQIGYNVIYDGTNLYFCKGSFVWDPSYRLVAQSVDTAQYIFLDQFVANVYFSNIAAMDLSSYLQSGQIYNFYIFKSNLETAWNLNTYNTYYTGINSICFVKVENNDVIGQSSYNEGRTDGFEQGRLSGYYEGWADGYAQGELVAPADGQYTFLGVIGALFDAPVNSLKTFLDFDLLGFNMKSFVFAMLTLAFIVLIIRLILGSKS